jgi:hypothetical protein
MKRKANLSEMLMLRVTPEDLQKLDEIHKKVALLPRAQLAREAMRLGLRQLHDGDPAQLLLGGDIEVKKKR